MRDPLDYRRCAAVRGGPACVGPVGALGRSHPSRARPAPSPSTATCPTGVAARDAGRKWYETNPGDNTEPKVKNVGYLTFDERYLYAAFEFEDPNPSAIRAPFADRDNIRQRLQRLRRRHARRAQHRLERRSSSSPRRGTCSTTRSSTTRPTRTARRTSSGTRRRRSPSAAGRSRCASRSRRSATRTSIRRRGASCCTATIRATSTTSSSRRSIPRDSNCFVCRANVLTGLEQLPAGGHIVVAPYAAASASPSAGGDAGSPLGDAVRAGARRRGREIPAERRQRHRPDGQAGLLAGRVRHRADRHEPALRAVLSREAAVLPRGRRSVRDADPGGLHADDHGARCRRPRHRQKPASATRCSSRTTTAGAARSSGPDGLVVGARRLRIDGVHRARQARIGLSFISVLATDREHHGSDAAGSTGGGEPTTASSGRIFSGGFPARRRDGQ